jgi:DNA repair ATPase RecN
MKALSIFFLNQREDRSVNKVTSGGQLSRIGMMLKPIPWFT